MEQITIACEGLIGQLENTLARVTDEEFVRQSPALGGSTIGQHVRHTLEFFLCLEGGVAIGVVNYDKRAHSREMETDRSAAMAALNRVQQFVEDALEDLELKLEVCYGREQEDFYPIGTSLSRELAYNLEHTIHHMAIIKIGLRDIAAHVHLPPDFGVAASTLRFRRTSPVPASIASVNS